MDLNGTMKILIGKEQNNFLQIFIYNFGLKNVQIVQYEFTKMEDVSMLDVGIVNMSFAGYVQILGNNMTTNNARIP